MLNGVSKFEEAREARRSARPMGAVSLKPFNAERLAAPSLKSLTAADLGGPRFTIPQFHSLTKTDFTPGVKGTIQPLRPLEQSAPVVPAADTAKLREQAHKLVTQVFLSPVMKQMRQSPFRSKLMDGGRGGEAFGGMYDQHLLDRMAKTIGPKLAGPMVRRIEARQAYAKQQKPSLNEAAVSNPKSGISNPTFEIPNLQSEIGNPQSAIRNPK